MNKIDSGVAEMLHRAAIKEPMHALCRTRSAAAGGGAWVCPADRTPAVRAHASMLWI
jgi:hypothetical protein